MKEDMEFRNRLIELRKQKGWSQEDLGEKLDVSRQTVSKWENGETTPEITKLVKMSKLYNLTVDELVNGKDESKPVEIDAKVISNDKTQIIIKDESTQSTEVTTVSGKVGNETKKKSFIRRHLRKIIIAFVIILLITYLGFSAYKFCILKEINDKFNEYKNVNNCYYERKEIVTNNTTGTAYILNTRYWYKDGLLKIENIRTENGVTQTFFDYIDFNKEERYILYVDTNKVVKTKNTNEYKEIEKDILKYTIGENYYKSDIDIIKVSLNIFNNISLNKDIYIKEKNNFNKKTIKKYNRETKIIEQSSILKDSGEEEKILYDVKIGTVKDEDVRIENVDLSNYEIIEQ